MTVARTYKQILLPEKQQQVNLTEDRIILTSTSWISYACRFSLREYSSSFQTWLCGLLYTVQSLCKSFLLLSLLSQDHMTDNICIARDTQPVLSVLSTYPTRANLCSPWNMAVCEHGHVVYKEGEKRREGHSEVKTQWGLWGFSPKFVKLNFPRFL